MTRLPSYQARQRRKKHLVLDQMDFMDQMNRKNCGPTYIVATRTRWIDCYDKTGDPVERGFSLFFWSKKVYRGSVVRRRTDAKPILNHKKRRKN